MNSKKKKDEIRRLQKGLNMEVKQLPEARRKKEEWINIWFVYSTQ